MIDINKKYWHLYFGQDTRGKHRMSNNSYTLNDLIFLCETSSYAIECAVCCKKHNENVHVFTQQEANRILKLNQL